MCYSQHWLTVTSLTWVFHTCFSLNAPFPENITVWLWCLPSLCCQCWGWILKSPLSKDPPLAFVTCHLCSVFHDAWVQMSCWPQPSLWILRKNCGWTADILTHWASASSSSGNALVTWENLLSHFACRLSNIANKLLHSTLPRGGHMIQMRRDQQILLPVWELPASCPLRSPAG